MFALFKPASLRQLVLTSFALALIPLGVLLWQGHSALTSINERAMREAQEAVRHARQVENMDSLVINIERAVRQYDVVRSTSTQQIAANQIESYQTDLQELCAPEQALGQMPVCHLQRELLAELTDGFVDADSDKLNRILRDLRSQQSQLNNLIWQRLNTRLLEQREYVDQQQRELTWQTIVLVLLTLLLVAWSSSRISTPIKRLDRMIRAIGRQKHAPPQASINGPRELNELGERLNWLSGRLQQLEALRLALLRHASHELKTPLASIKEGCSLLADGVTGSLNPRQREVLSLLSGSTERLAQLTEQLLDYNQLLQQSEVKWEIFDPNELLQSTARQHALALQQRGQQLEIQCEVSRIHTDPTLLQRILDNLLNNAQAYGAQNGRVRVRVIDLTPTIILEVANTGPRIAQDQRETLFEPFQRGQLPRMDAVQGSGLGLSVVADCARMLEGRAEITDCEGFDMCVRVHLPIRETKAT